MNVLVVDFKKKRLMKMVKTKKEHNRTNKERDDDIAVYLRDIKESLPHCQYVSVLEGMISPVHYKKLKNKQQLISIIRNFDIYC